MKIEFRATTEATKDALMDICAEGRRDDIRTNGTFMSLRLNESYDIFIQDMKDDVGIVLDSSDIDGFYITAKVFKNMIFALKLFSNTSGVKKYQCLMDLFNESNIPIYFFEPSFHYCFPFWDEKICWLTYDEGLAIKQKLALGGNFLANFWHEPYLSVAINLAKAVGEVAPVYEEVPDQELIYIFEVWE